MFNVEKKFISFTLKRFLEDKWYFWSCLHLKIDGLINIVNAVRHHTVEEVKNKAHFLSKGYDSNVFP